jgi:antitoxin component HigA of HigAB toxin-antitoxin module
VLYRNPEPPETIEAIRYRMETGGYTRADLGRLLGSR